jgi:hypothetical protein
MFAMSNKFSNAFKAQKQEPEKPPAEEAEVGRGPTASRARRKLKHVGGYFDPAVSRQLRELAARQDTIVQALVAQAVNMLFQAHNLPQIAEE